MQKLAFLKYSPYLCKRKRKGQVEPRCAERWHLRDDEQFDLATWPPSQILPPYYIKFSRPMP